MEEKIYNIIYQDGNFSANTTRRLAKLIAEELNPVENLFSEISDKLTKSLHNDLEEIKGILGENNKCVDKIDYDEKMITEFITHYEEYRSVYLEWEKTKIAEVFVKNFNLINKTKQV